MKTMRSSIALFSIALIGLLCCVSSVYAQTKKEKADLIVTGGAVVTMNAERRIIEDGAVAVKGDAIVAVGPRAAVEAKYSGAQTIDAKGKLVLPGLINGHTHVPMTLLRGLKDDVTLEERSEEHTSELQSPCNLVCRLLLEKKKKQKSIKW